MSVRILPVRYDHEDHRQVVEAAAIKIPAVHGTPELARSLRERDLGLNMLHFIGGALKAEVYAPISFRFYQTDADAETVGNGVEIASNQDCDSAKVDFPVNTDRLRDEDGAEWHNRSLWLATLAAAIALDPVNGERVRRAHQFKKLLIEGLFAAATAVVWGFGGVAPPNIETVEPPSPTETIDGAIGDMFRHRHNRLRAAELAREFPVFEAIG